jgi:hypothetical protein
MTLDILRRTGGWCVELQQPLKLGPGKEITQIEIRPMTADHTIRWGEEAIPSTLALLSELCDVPERALRQLLHQDFDRVMMALGNVVSSIVKKSWEEGTRPLSTPDELLPAQEQFVPAVDQQDPRFPDAGGPVVRMQPGPIISPPAPQRDPADNGSGMNLSMPNVVAPVH